MSNLESLLYGLACSLILLASYILVEPVIGYERVVNEPTDTRPDILTPYQRAIFDDNARL